MLGRATLAGALGLASLAGCADKAPEPKWPEPPPPTLAEPIGQEPPAAPEAAPAAEPSVDVESASQDRPPAQPNAPEDGAVRIDR